MPEQTVDAAQALRQLERIDHIVVLMLENRSFDQMLGYLSLEPWRSRRRQSVEGLEPGRSNPASDGTPVEAFPFPPGFTQLTKEEDAGHNRADVDMQVNAGAMDGFVRNFEQACPHARSRDLVMGYYTPEHVPVYDHLAAEFCVCDHWHCSVPGATWPNRLFALTGGPAGPADEDRDNVNPPLYSLHRDLASLFRQLDERPRQRLEWRWYSTDPGTLRLVDRRYLVGPDERFAYFDRRTVFEHDTFLDEAKGGRLPNVCFIDPNFIDLGGPGGANDDHPPSDVRAGQELVLRVYRALATSPQWGKSMLVVVYDEHGGFHDHVPPPETGDPAPFDRYGPRVPAFVVSPLVERGSVCSTLFDHTSLVRTILARFCKPEAVDAMPPRVQRARHLGEVLTLASPRPAPVVDEAVVAPLVERRVKALVDGLLNPLPAQVPITGVGTPAAAIGELRHRFDRHVRPLLRKLELRVRRAFARRRFVRVGDAPPPAQLPLAGELEQGLYDAFREVRRRGLPSGKP